MDELLGDERLDLELFKRDLVRVWIAFRSLIAGPSFMFKIPVKWCSVSSSRADPSTL